MQHQTMAREPRARQITFTALLIMATMFGMGKELMAQANASTTVKNIVLVHGGFVDGSGWEGVYNALTNDGYTVTIVQNPTISLEDDVAVTKPPNSAPGQPLECGARFVPFPATPTAPEMEGKIPPEDHTLYVAADGTGLGSGLFDRSFQQIHASGRETDQCAFGGSLEADGPSDTR